MGGGRSRGTVQPTPMSALVVSGMNDVLNAEGYAQAAWWNRIPISAWVLLGVIAVGCNLLLGYRAHRPSILLMVLPSVVSILFSLPLTSITPARWADSRATSKLNALSKSYGSPVSRHRSPLRRFSVSGTYYCSSRPDGHGQGHFRRASIGHAAPKGSGAAGMRCAQRD